jgi:Fe2+ or Zn2+ uptake regulation protein
MVLRLTLDRWYHDFMVDVHEVVQTRLQDAGQRYTPNHRRIVAGLHDAPNPLTLPSLLRKCRSLPQSSAYRSLAVLEHAGAVRRLVASGGHASWELAEDLTDHHHHRVCKTCGQIEDFTLPPAVEAALDKALRASARKAKFVPDDHQLDLLGQCARCAARR